MNTTFFQKPRIQWSNIEKKAFEEIQNICQRHDGDAEARYGAWDAMIWLSSQPEIQLTNTWKPSREDLISLEYCVEHYCPELQTFYSDIKKYFGI